MPPRTLYRVFDASSMRQYDPEVGFRAMDQSWTIRDWNDSLKMHKALSCHLDCRNRTPTPFISTSANRDRSLDEAKRWLRAGKHDLRVAIIDTSELDNDTIYESVKTVAELHGVVHEFVNPEEYLFLGGIPADSVTEVIDIHEPDHYRSVFIKDYFNVIEPPKYYKPKSRSKSGIRGIDYFVDDFGDIHSDEDSANEANDWGHCLEYVLDH